MRQAEYSPAARRVGIWSAIAVVALATGYAVTLVAGFLSLRSPHEPIGDPMFSILEILILAMMPAMVALMAVVHAWAPAQAKAFTLTAVVFLGLTAGVTCCVHVAVLTLSRQAEFSGAPWFPLVLSFRWPSVVYALDITAWDFFFPVSMWFAAPAFEGSRLAVTIRALLIASGAAAFAGWIGVAAGDMQLRNIGIAGYAGIFPVAAGLLAVLFYRTKPDEA